MSEKRSIRSALAGGLGALSGAIVNHIASNANIAQPWSLLLGIAVAIGVALFITKI